MDTQDALALLEKYASGDTSWLAHCHRVGTACRCLAEVMVRRGHAVDAERAAVLGLLHDIGRCRGHDLRHGIEGYLLTRAEGHEIEGRICLVHILKGRTLEQGVELGMLSEAERRELQQSRHEYDHLSLEEKITCVADALMSNIRLATIEQKYAKARGRYGAFPHHNQDEAWVKRIAAELAELLGDTPYRVLKQESNDLL